MGGNNWTGQPSAGYCRLAESFVDGGVLIGLRWAGSRHRPGSQEEDLRVAEPPRVLAVTEPLVKGGERRKDDTTVEPKEEYRQWQLAPKSCEQCHPLVAMPNRRDDIEPCVTQQQRPCDDRSCRDDLAVEPRRPGGVAKHKDEPDVEAGPQQIPVSCVVLGRKGLTEKHGPGHQAGRHQHEDGSHQLAASGERNARRTGPPPGGMASSAFGWLTVPDDFATLPRALRGRRGPRGAGRT